MRDYGLILVVLVLIPLIFKRPQNGIFAWSWISYMNPHRMTWGIAYSLPLAQVVARDLSRDYPTRGGPAPSLHGAPPA